MRRTLSRGLIVLALLGGPETAKATENVTVENRAWPGIASSVPQMPLALAVRGACPAA